MNNVIEPIVTIVTAIIGVALVATLVSNNAQTGNVLSAFGGMISNMLSAATGPVTGQAAQPNVNAGSNSGGLGNLNLNFNQQQPTNW